MPGTVVYDPNLTKIDVSRQQTEERKVKQEAYKRISEEFRQLAIEFTNREYCAFTKAKPLNEEERRFLNDRIQELRTILGQLKPSLDC
jgi:hypothetical protein